ncbi:MAG: histidine phosphotransferase family protein [Tagaea sp.]
MEDTDLRLLELIAARMCHDLVGPVGAAVNGAELLAEGEAADVEVVRLIGQSARQASRRLQVFRVIYGTPGALSGAAPFAQAGQLLGAMLEGEKAALDWRVDPAVEAGVGRVGARLVLLLALACVEALPRGGQVRVSGTVVGGRATLEAAAIGQGAKFADEASAAFVGRTPPAQLTPKVAPCELACRLARAAGGGIDVGQGAEGPILRAILPASSSV